jgi:uncharacterized damage-inducible protein DinB
MDDCLLARICLLVLEEFLMSDDVLVKLFEHNNWANIQMVQACAALSDEQLDSEPHSATKGTIRQTLLHLVSSQRGYLALLTLPVEERKKVSLDFADLKEVVQSSGEALLAMIKQDEIPKTRLQTTDGYYVEPWVVLLQIINHATEHREQINSMLSALGLTPLDQDGWSYGEFTNSLVPISK